MSKKSLVFVAMMVILSACGVPATPTNPTNGTEITTSTVRPAVTDTQIASLKATPVSLPTEGPISPTTLPSSPTPLLITDSSIPLSERIVYYYFVTSAETPAPEGSVMISSTYILAPTFSDIASSPDTADDLRTALVAVLNDGRNGWISSKLDIGDVAFGDEHADVVLQGEYFGVGDVTLITASMQILMTVFANPSVQTATVTLNGDTIGNLGVSNSMNAKPADYIFTRAEIETFMKEHAYGSP